MEKAYKKVVWEVPSDWDSRTAFEKAVRRLEMSSSPGLPYMKEATTNGQWLGFDGIQFDTWKMDRLWHDVNLVMSDEWDTLLRVFIKQEPHKITKVKEKRWRLIMATPLCVQVVWHMCFDYMNDLEIEHAYEIPSQQGLILTKGGWKTYRKQWESLNTTVGLDKSAWDWTFPTWALSDCLEFRRRMGRGPRLNDWFVIADLLYRHMFQDPKLVLSDGTLLQQIVPGVMKSGCVNTISDNSHGQVLMHLIVCADMCLDPYPLPRAVGDDTLQHPDHVSSIEGYTKYGIVIKSVSECIEFVGHEFTATGPHPLYMSKHLKRLVYTKEEILSQYLDSMARMYVHTRYYSFWERIGWELGILLPLSKEAYLDWYDFEE